MKNLILTAVFLCFLNSCTKDSAVATPPDTLPPITTSGANTAGCIISGKVLIPKNGSQAIGGSPLYGLKLNAGGNFHPPTIGGDYWQLEIANKKDANGAGIILWIKNMSIGNGDYIVGQSNGELNSLGPNNNQIIAGISENGINKTYWSAVSAGTIVISRFDYPNGIYAGTFSCTLYNKANPSETIQITDGRFDISLSTLNR